MGIVGAHHESPLRAYDRVNNNFSRHSSYHPGIFFTKWIGVDWVMILKMSELRCKEVICVADGRRLGFVCDMEIESPEGCVKAIIVPGPCRFLGLFGRRDDFVIPWQ